MLMPGVGENKNAHLVHCQDGSGSKKEARLSSIVAFGKGTELLHSPLLI